MNDSLKTYQRVVPTETELRYALSKLHDPNEREWALSVLRLHPDWNTPNWCSTCTPAGYGCCRCEIACNE